MATPLERRRNLIADEGSRDGGHEAPDPPDDETPEGEHPGPCQERHAPKERRIGQQARDDERENDRART